MLPVFADAVEVIGKDENGISSEEAAQNVSCADILESPGQKQEKTESDQSEGATDRQHGKPDLKVD
ncbi:MAG: hypothetical protein IJ950_07500, partial [Helicobacter sp.]|nr:hypothetical protein [Helicobacter sp.]